LHETHRGYLAFLGRISPEKRVDRAIEIACRTGMELKISAKVDAVDREYFEQEIEPLLQNPLIEFVGEISEKEKGDFLGNARALLFPIDWPEPFGLVMIEALACGTPVIACRRGSVPEIIEDGVTGFIVNGVEEGVNAVNRLDTISRRRCRQIFDQRFTSSQMLNGYLGIYENLLCRREFISRSVA
jgi:glycosyltransferase involved in cell wall biosynthesis